MKENWIQLIDTIEKDPFETEAFFALYARHEHCLTGGSPE